MPNHTSLASLFGDIADAIRAKTGSAASIVADNFPSAIAAISGGGTVAGATESGDDSDYIEFSVNGEPVMWALQVEGSFKKITTAQQVVACQWPFQNGGFTYTRCAFLTYTNNTANDIGYGLYTNLYTYDNGRVIIDMNGQGIFANGKTYRLLYVY